MAKGSVNGSCSVTYEGDDKYTLTCSGSYTFGDYWQYGVRVRCYINGSERGTAAGYTTASYQTCASCSGSLDIERTRSAQTILWEVTSEGEAIQIDEAPWEISGLGETDSISGKITVPALPSYTITYNGNASGDLVSDMPENCTKWYGEDLTLPSVSRIGYTFLGWSEDSSATEATYSAGDNYTENKNSNQTLLTFNI